MNVVSVTDAVSILQVFPGVDRLTSTGAEFENGQSGSYDAIIFATGYRSNVPQWLKVNN